MSRRSRPAPVELFALWFVRPDWHAGTGERGRRTLREQEVERSTLSETRAATGRPDLALARLAREAGLNEDALRRAYSRRQDDLSPEWLMFAVLGGPAGKPVFIHARRLPAGAD